MANRVRRDPVGQGRETNERLDLLERRVGSLVIPTIPDEYVLPDRLGPSGQSSADWNTALDPGFYFSASGATNAPAGATGTLVGLVRRGEGGVVVQEISASGATGTNPQRFTWRRQRDAGGAWGAWYAFTGEVLASQIAGVLDDDLIPTLDLATKTSGILPAERVGGVAWVDVSGKPATFPPSAHTHTASQITDFQTSVDARVNTLVPVASTTVQGKVELATDAETQTGTDATRAITPSNLSARTATETRTGIAELATTVEAVTGTDTLRIVTPAGLRAALNAAHAVPATPTGFALSGGDGGRNPGGLPGATKIYQWTQPAGGVAVDHYEVWGTQNGTTVPILVASSKTTEARIYETPGMWTSMSLAVRAVSVNGVPSAFSNAVAYEQFNPDLSASTDYEGIAELATLSEVLAGTDAERIVTPYTLVETDPARWIEVVKGGPSVQDGDYQVQFAPYTIAFSRTSTNENMSLGASGLNWGIGATNSYLEPEPPTASRTLLLPDRSGTLATTDQLAGAASETDAGLVELATAAEAAAGTDTTKAITPATLKSALMVPAVSEAFGSPIITYTAPTSGWTNVPGVAVTLSSLPRQLLVAVTVSAQVSTNRSDYGVILGINVTGATTVAPDVEQATGTSRPYAYTPTVVPIPAGSTASENVRVTKTITLNAGSTTLAGQISLDPDDGTNNAGLFGARIEVLPLRWVG